MVMEIKPVKKYSAPVYAKAAAVAAAIGTLTGCATTGIAPNPEYEGDTSAYETTEEVKLAGDVYAPSDSETTPVKGFEGMTLGTQGTTAAVGLTGTVQVSAECTEDCTETVSSEEEVYLAGEVDAADITEGEDDLQLIGEEAVYYPYEEKYLLIEDVCSERGIDVQYAEEELLAGYMWFDEYLICDEHDIAIIIVNSDSVGEFEEKYVEERNPEKTSFGYLDTVRLGQRELTAVFIVCDECSDGDVTEKASAAFDLLIEKGLIV